MLGRHPRRQGWDTRKSEAVPSAARPVLGNTSSPFQGPTDSLSEECPERRKNT